MDRCAAQHNSTADQPDTARNVGHAPGTFGPGTFERRSARRVLLVTAGVGAGHNAVARALYDGMLDRWPSIEAQIVDVLESAPAFFRAVLLGGHVQGMTRAPWLYGRFYRAADRGRVGAFGIGERLRNRIVGRALRHLILLAREFRPDFILHMHWCGISALARPEACETLCDEQAVVVTDVLAHRYWYSPHIRRWFVAAPEALEKFRAWGVGDESVTISGIPVHRRWDDFPPADRVRFEWALPPEGPLVLVSGGASFTVGRIGMLARDIRAACPGAAVVVLCGTNGALRDELEALPGAGTSLFAIPFTDRAHELVSAATLFVTKPGGVTTAECLAAGTPMVLLPPVPCQEGENAAWLEQHGAAVVARRQRDVVWHVTRLLQNEHARAELAASARALYQPGREIVLDFVGERLGLG